jgi:hypothetical protein
MANDPRFLSPMGSRLRELGLDVKDVNVGRYIQIDLSEPRPEPEEFAEFGEFDTFVVLNPHELPADAKLWLYFNNKRPESRMPLHRLSRLETVADRFYLQHADSWEGVTLEVLIGGDLRALNVDPRDKGTVTLERAYIDVTDRPNRKLGNVNAEVTGEVDITDRPTRELGSVSVPGVATELTLEEARTLLESLDGKDFATQSTLAAVLDKLDNLEVKLKGSTVEIGGVNYDFDPPRTLYGPAASRPSASDAHAAVPYVVYVSVDTKVIEQTDGTNWRRWGVV